MASSPGVVVPPTQLLLGYPVIVPIAVQWGEMDAFGHVNNAVYFRWQETARIAYFAQMDVLDRSGKDGGIGPVLAHTSCRFILPVAHPDTVFVGAKVTDVGEYSITMEYATVGDMANKLAASGDALVVPFDFAGRRKALVPDAWRTAIARVERA